MREALLKLNSRNIRVYPYGMYFELVDKTNMNTLAVLKGSQSVIDYARRIAA